MYDDLHESWQRVTSIDTLHDRSIYSNSCLHDIQTRRHGGYEVNNTHSPTMSPLEPKNRVGPATWEMEDFEMDVAQASLTKLSYTISYGP